MLMKCLLSKFTYVFIQLFVFAILFDYFDIIALIEFERVSWANEIENDLWWKNTIDAWKHLYYRYVDRLKETLKQMLSLADKMVFLEKQMVVKYKDADSELREIQPKLELVIKRTKEMQKQVSIF